MILERQLTTVSSMVTHWIPLGKRMSHSLYFLSLRWLVRPLPQEDFETDMRTLLAGNKSKPMQGFHLHKSSFSFYGISPPENWYSCYCLTVHRSATTFSKPEKITLCLSQVARNEMAEQWLCSTYWLTRQLRTWWDLVLVQFVCKYHKITLPNLLITRYP